MDRTITRRSSIVLAFGAAVVAAIFGRRRSQAKPAFVEKTAPGDRYRTLRVGDREIYVREDLVAGGWYRDFEFHPKRGGQS